MYLKRLELFGFKSFHEKTVLEFNKGITAVVGPNGSGKSNISDAIRWVLGEQSVKSLRGSKMEDVIFSGTANRRGVGFAEVSMVLDNSCGSIVIDDNIKGKAKVETKKGQYGEISICRRVYRSGESQYLINGANVRLKDIHELFMDTGIGREGYSIIGQGRIEDVLSVKSEDRRMIFEEAAGIVKYKAKKNEAENKLEKERQNLIRVSDIISEIETQIEPLREMAEKAKKYLELAERLKLIKINSFLILASSQKEEGKTYQTNIDNLLQQKLDTESKRESQKLAFQQAKGELAQINNNITMLQSEILDISSKVDKRENDIKMAKQSIDYISEQIMRLMEEVKRETGFILDSEKEKKSFEVKHAQIENDMNTKTELENHIKLELDILNLSLFEKENDIQSFNDKHIEKIKTTTDVRSRIEVLTTTYSQLENRKEEINDEIYTLQKSLDAAALDCLETKKAMQEAESALRYCSVNEENFDRAKNKLTEYYDSFKRDYNNELNALSEAKSKYKLLSELEANYEGYQYSVKNLMLASKKNDALKGLHGALGELIQTPPAYETAVESSLGGAIMDIVTDNEESAKTAIEYLKTSKGGRATFLPISAIKPRELGKIKDILLKEKGVLGAAPDFIECNTEYRNIILNLLGRVLIVDNIDNAINFSIKYKNEYKVVTLPGEIFNPGGSITGGFRGKNSKILGRKREIISLEYKINNLGISVESRTKELNEVSQKLESVNRQLQENKIISHEIQIKKATLESALEQKLKAISDLNHKLKILENSDREILKRLETLNIEIKENVNAHKIIESQISGLLSEISDKQQILKENRTARDSKIKELSAIQVEKSRMSELINSSLENVNRIQKSIENSFLKIKRLEQDSEFQQIEIENKKNDVERISEEIQKLFSEKKEKEKHLENLQRQRDLTSEKASILSENELEFVQLISRLDIELERLFTKKEQLDSERNKLYDEMWEEYNLTFQSAQTYERLNLSMLKLRQEEHSLKNEIRKMGGTVNTGAVEEYRLIKERYEFLVKQRDDILLTEEKLRDVILELKRLMEERFLSQLSIISKNFGEAFAEMFGGGTACLKLADESNVLESGIDIIAKPPGKALQSLTLFSGGERALCAIALLFGILRMKPSPFCVLDEIETALDDANVKRFAKFIKNYSNGTQFIVITHRKGTMEEADVLYGVTMQEAGVSKLVSVKFSDAKEEAS